MSLPLGMVIDTQEKVSILHACRSTEGITEIGIFRAVLESGSPVSFERCLQMIRWLSFNGLLRSPKFGSYCTTPAGDELLSLLEAVMAPPAVANATSFAAALAIVLGRDESGDTAVTQ